VRRLLTLILITGLVLSFTACGEEEEPEPTEQGPAATATVEATEEGPAETPEGAAGGLTQEPMLEDIAENPSEYYGQTVTVYGNVDEMIGPGSITLAGTAFLDENDVLVVGAPVEAVEEAEDEDVLLEVRGDVRQFDLAEIEEDFDLDLEDDAYADFEGEPVIVAESARALTAQALYSDRETTLATVIARSDDFYGEQVGVGGAVTGMVTERAFGLVPTVFPGDTPVLVVAQSEDVLDVELAPDDLVQVQGEVRRFDRAEIEEELGLDLEAYPDYEDELLIVADSVLRMADSDAALVRRTRLLRPADIDDERMLQAIVRAPDDFYGRWTSVLGGVAQKVGERGFVLEGSSLPIEGGLLVITLFENLPVPIEEGLTVRVAGEVRQFSPTEFEEAADVDLSGGAYAEYEGQPVMVAETLRVVSDRQMRLVREGALELISRNPEVYLDQQVTVAGTVNRVLGDGAFTVLGDGLLADDEVLILGVSEGAQAVEVGEGERLRITGTLRRFDAAAMEGEVDVDLDDDSFAAFEDEAVIMAESIEATASE